MKNVKYSTGIEFYSTGNLASFMNIVIATLIFINCATMIEHWRGGTDTLKTVVFSEAAINECGSKNVGSKHSNCYFRTSTMESLDDASRNPTILLLAIATAMIVVRRKSEDEGDEK